jgi:hypothetical protein
VNVTLSNHTANNVDGTLQNFSLLTGCMSNWTTGSNKITNCSGCIASLELNSGSGMIDGTYTASSMITVKPGTQFMTGGNITLDAPTVLFETDNAVPATTILTIKQDGCPD